MGEAISIASLSISKCEILSFNSNTIRSAVFLPTPDTLESFSIFADCENKIKEFLAQSRLSDEQKAKYYSDFLNIKFT